MRRRLIEQRLLRGVAGVIFSSAIQVEDQLQLRFAVGDAGELLELLQYSKPVSTVGSNIVPSPKSLNVASCRKSMSRRVRGRVGSN